MILFRFDGVEESRCMNMKIIKVMMACHAMGNKKKKMIDELMLRVTKKNR